MALTTKASLRKRGGASKYTRIQNVSTEQTVKATAGILQRIVLTNANAAVQSLTVTDGSTTLGIFEVGADTTLSLQFGCAMDTSIKVTPSHANIDALIIWD